MDEKGSVIYDLLSIIYMRNILLYFLLFHLFNSSFGQDNISKNKFVLKHQNRITKKFNSLGLELHEFETNEHHINYFDGGQGPALLLIHGFGGNGSVTWRKQVKLLSKHYRLIIPDLCWFNKSYSNNPPNLKSQTDALLGLLDSIEISKYSLAGISYGGYVSLALANRFPEKIEKLIIIDCPGHTYDISLLDTLAQMVDAKNVEDIFVPTSPKELKRLLKLASHSPLFIPKGILRQIFEVHFSNYHSEQRELIKTLPTTVDLDKIDTNKFDCLMIWGQKDKVFSLSEGEKLSKALNARFVVIKRAGHTVILERSKKFNSILMEFLQSN